MTTLCVSHVADAIDSNEGCGRVWVVANRIFAASKNVRRAEPRKTQLQHNQRTNNPATSGIALLHLHTSSLLFKTELQQPSARPIPALP